MKFLITDYDFPNVDLELELFRDAGFEAETAQCRTEDDLIAAAQGCDGLLAQYAPVTDRVMAALPDMRIVSCSCCPGRVCTSMASRRFASAACTGPLWSAVIAHASANHAAAPKTRLIALWRFIAIRTP